MTSAPSSKYFVFDQDLCKAMADAFDEICDELRTRQAPAFDLYDVAKRVIALAQKGERDATTIAKLILRPQPDTLH